MLEVEWARNLRSLSKDPNLGSALTQRDQRGRDWLNARVGMASLQMSLLIFNNAIESWNRHGRWKEVQLELTPPVSSL